MRFIPLVKGIEIEWEKEMKYIIIILTVLLLLTACNTTKEETINIGVVATLSSHGAYLGEQEIKGVTLAQEHLNSNGGINGKQIKNPFYKRNYILKFRAPNIMHVLCRYFKPFIFLRI